MWGKAFSWWLFVRFDLWKGLGNDESSTSRIGYRIYWTDYPTAGSEIPNNRECVLCFCFILNYYSYWIIQFPPTLHYELINKLIFYRKFSMWMSEGMVWADGRAGIRMRTRMLQFPNNSNSFSYKLQSKCAGLKLILSLITSWCRADSESSPSQHSTGGNLKYILSENGIIELCLFRYGFHTSTFNRAADGRPGTEWRLCTAT